VLRACGMIKCRCSGAPQNLGNGSSNGGSGRRHSNSSSVRLSTNLKMKLQEML
jgi:hypothetical protein